MRLAAAMLIATTSLAYADDTHNHPPQDSKLHEQFYVTWLVPNNGNPRVSNCCNKRDCYPTKFKYSDGSWYALRREDQRWILVPENRFEHNQPDPRESPDGNNHVCMVHPGGGRMVYCAVLGSPI